MYPAASPAQGRSQTGLQPEGTAADIPPEDLTHARPRPRPVPAGDPEPRVTIMDDRTSQEATPQRAATTPTAGPSFDPRDLIPTPIFCASPEGRLAWMNGAAESLTGRHAASVAGESFTCMFPDEWKRKVARSMLRERRQGRTEFYLEAPIVTGGVDTRWVGLHIRLATAANGRSAYVCAAHDLHEIHTEIDVLKRRTREMAARLEEATAGAELKSNFLASMSGELRAPMNGVIGMSRLLLDSNLDRDQRTWTEVIQGSGQQLLELVDDILDYSRIESGQLAIGSMDFDLRVTVDAVASLLSTQAHDSNVHFSSVVHHRVPSLVNGDPGRVRQVLLQLAQCALDQAEGGEVQLRVELVEETAHQAVAPLLGESHRAPRSAATPRPSPGCSRCTAAMRRRAAASADGPWA